MNKFFASLLILALGCSSPCDCRRARPWAITETKSTPRTDALVETPVDPLVTRPRLAPGEPGAGAADRYQEPETGTETEPETEPEAEPGTSEAEAENDIYLVKWSAEWCFPCKWWDRDHKQAILSAGYTITTLDFDSDGGREAGVEKLPAFVFCSRSTGKKVYPREGYLYGTAATTLLNGLRQQNATETSPEAAPAASGDPEASGDPMAATVRVQISNGRFMEVGTGTVVRSDSTGSIVITASHLFNTGGRITVETFGARPGTYPGTLVSRTRPQDSDLAVVRLAAGGLSSVSIFDGQALKGQKLVSIGCSNGAQPTSTEIEVLNVNFYGGPENLICSTFPAHGRSGGGAFDIRGRLVAVCTARRDGHGLYTGTKPIRDILKGRL